MQITISGHHVEVTDALREYVESKFDRLQRHYSQITKVEVTLNVEKLVQKAEATVHIAGKDLFAAGGLGRHVRGHRRPGGQARPTAHQAQGKAARSAR
jgi:hypothetical protein